MTDVSNQREDSELDAVRHHAIEHAQVERLPYLIAALIGAVDPPPKGKFGQSVLGCIERGRSDERLPLQHLLLPSQKTKRLVV